MRAGMWVASALLCCCLFAVPAIADAKVREAPTQVVLVGADLQSMSAELQNPFKGCLRERTITLTDLGSGAVFHTTTTTRDGLFSIALGDIPRGTTTLTVRVSATPERRGSRLCESDSADVAFDWATLTGGPSGGAFRGVLSSSVDACEPGRVISLYEVSVPEEPVFVGSNFTDASGAWVIAQAGGFYYAEASLAFIGGGDSFSYCRPVASPSWFFEEPTE
jgi:hypothetical protein